MERRAGAGPEEKPALILLTSCFRASMAKRSAGPEIESHHPNRFPSHADGQIDEIDRVIGFELGADDLCHKPFSPRELILRIRHPFGGKSPPGKPSRPLRIGDLLIEYDRHTGFIKRTPLQLTSTEFSSWWKLASKRGPC